MSAILIHNARVLTMLKAGETRPPTGGRRGGDMGTLGVLESASVLVEGDRITGVGTGQLKAPAGAFVCDAGGRVVMPGFVDCHTHACWAGSRLDEWERKLAGATYQDIAAAGGGIMSTVRAVRDATGDALWAGLLARIDLMARLGTTTIEVKSGYGLSLEHELKMIRAIDAARAQCVVTIVPTALLGHAIDPAAESAEEFVQETVEKTLPQVSSSWPRMVIDAFCEKGAWTRAQCERLFARAKELGHPIRIHADQFTSMGMVESAVRMKARSVDHLEASSDETLGVLAASDTFGVGLPVCGFHLDGRYARLGEVVKRGGKVCVATNCNPGSAPSSSMPLAVALAVRHCGLTVAQAIVAATVNPAALLGLDDRGYIASGARADLIVLRHRDERGLAYEVGDNPVDMVAAGGAKWFR